MKFNIEKTDYVIFTGSDLEELFKQIHKLYGDKFKTINAMYSKKIGAIAKVYF